MNQAISLKLDDGVRTVIMGIFRGIGGAHDKGMAETASFLYNNEISYVKYGVA